MGKDIITIKEITNSNKKAEITDAILHSLPDWFEVEKSISDYIESSQKLPFFVTEKDNQIVGFIVIEDFNEWASEIHVMGVLPEYRGKGIGKKLVEHVWARNKKLGKKYLTVKTLDESAGDKFYSETRKFYTAMGFLPIMMSTKIWDEENPCLIMIKEK